jgi:hypothetical protein
MSEGREKMSLSRKHQEALMKRCSTCHEMLALTEFNVRRLSRDGLQSRCRGCSRRWYEENRERHMKNALRRTNAVRRENKERVAAYFADHPCADCGEDDVRVLEFDHRPGELKSDDVATLLNNGFAWRNVIAEINKCDVCCANCHRIRTCTRAANWRHELFLRLQMKAREDLLDGVSGAD